MYTPRVRTLTVLSVAFLAMSSLAGPPRHSTRPKVAQMLSQIKSLLQAKADRYPAVRGSKSYLQVGSITQSGIECMSFAGNKRDSHTENFGFQWSNVASTRADGKTVIIRLKKPVDVHLNTDMDGQNQHQVGLETKITFDFSRESDSKECNRKLVRLFRALGINAH